MNIVDLKFANILSNRLDRFQVKSTSPYKANVRCPICGDSHKSKTKARGWILENPKGVSYYCHNCGASMPFGLFLKQIEPALYNDYVIDKKLEKAQLSKFAESTVHHDELPPLDKLVTKQPNFTKGTSPLLKIKKISSLHHEHPAKKYVVGRLIPPHQHHRLYYAPKFNKWVNSIIPDKLNAERDEPRLVIPFIDRQGNLFGFAGRSFDPKATLRYITIMFNDDHDKIFGLDKVDFDRRYYVVEGQLDSLFLNNAVAMAGAEGNVSGLNNTRNAVMVFDNEPRNKDTINRMAKAIDKGLNVVIWPQNIEQKDINDMVKAGLKSVDIEMIIDHNTYSGLEAKLALTIWRRT